MVIVHHTFPTGGFHDQTGYIELVTRLSVPGFFVLSGMLITRSWLHSKRSRDYFKNRALRIMPGYWVCLIVAAFGFGPLFAIVAGTAYFNFGPDGPFRYVIENSLLLQKQAHINHLPQGLPMPEVMNGSLWTLFNEAACYVAVAFAGWFGIFKRPWVLFVVLGILLFLLNLPRETIETFPIRVQRNLYEYLLFEHMMWFCLGSIAWMYRQHLKFHPALFVASVLLCAFAVWQRDIYRILPVPFAYALLYTGFKMPWFRSIDKRMDLSYGVYIYAFPVQQTLALFGAYKLGFTVFTILPMICVLPLAWASWTFVEKPALNLKKRKEKNVGQVVEGYAS